MKKRERRGLGLLVRAAAGLALFGFVSCGAVILQADFDADALGGDPAMNPAGDPADDRIIVLDGTFGVNSAEIVSDPAFETNAMAVLNPAAQNVFSTVNCISTEEDDTNTVVVSANWSGMYQPNGDSAPVVVTLRDAGSRVLAILQIDNNGVHYRNKVLNGALVPISPLPPNEEHRILITFNRTKDVVLFIALDSSGNGLDDYKQFKSLTDPTKQPLDLRIVTLQYLIDDTTGGPERYLVDEVVLKRDPPSTPTP